MNFPTFSIIIPHSNSAIENDPLLTTLASIADQEGVKIEILLQHGGGITGLWGKLSRVLNLSAKKEQITLRVIEEKSSSPEEALAAGVKRATGDWIGFLKPGEQYLPYVLVALQEAVEAHPEVDVFLTGAITPISNKLVMVPAVLPTSRYLTSSQTAWSAHSLFCRASLLRDDAALLQPCYQHQMITEWLLRALPSGKKIKILPTLTTLAPRNEEKKESLLPKATGMTALLKPWHQWRHQAALRQAQKAITLPDLILIYQDGSFAERARMRK
ncbi:MAG: glycosyltransferase [Verrucomicrobia bacterium]|nr:glycosyltransferase [Verrucomicrobiota bacterium]